MSSGRCPGDFWPRTEGWVAPGAASESEPENLEESSDRASHDDESEEDKVDDVDMPPAVLKKPSSNYKKPTPKTKTKSKAKSMKRPASALAMKKPSEEPEKITTDEGEASASPKPSASFKKPSAKVKTTTTTVKKTKNEKTEKTDKADRPIGCSRCRWKSGCRSCNWRGRDKPVEEPEHKIEKTKDDSEKSGGDHCGDDDAAEE